MFLLAIGRTEGAPLTWGLERLKRGWFMKPLWFPFCSTASCRCDSFEGLRPLSICKGVYFPCGKWSIGTSKLTLFIISIIWNLLVYAKLVWDHSALEVMVLRLHKALAGHFTVVLVLWHKSHEVPLCLCEGYQWWRVLKPNKWCLGVKFAFFSNEIINTFA